MMVDSQWSNVQEKTQTDIMSIVMNLVNGLESTGRTMELISTHCEACYDEGIIQATSMQLGVACDEFTDLQKENARLQQWINDLQSGMYVNCVYCGHRYGPSIDTPVAMADVLKKHIEECPEHPMSKLKKENKELHTDIRILLKAFQDMDKVFTKRGKRNIEL